MKNFYWIFRTPETMLAFISGALISGTINIFCNTEISQYYYIIAITLFVPSFNLVLWAIIAKPIEESYRSIIKTGDDRKAIWMEELNKFKRSKIFLIILFFISLLCILVSFILLVTFKQLQI